MQERSMTMEILRRLCPKEAELMRDPVVQAKVRFRFGGSSFPPTIMFKIFTKSNSVHYYSGNRMIQADMQAAVDSCTIMGVRLYSENMMRTEYQNRKLKVAHSDEVTNRLDFVQYISSLDQKPAYMGGRNNAWRELALTPSTGFSNLVYDIANRHPKHGSRKSTLVRSVRPRVRRPVAVKPRVTHHHAPRGHEEDMEDEDDGFDPLFEWTNRLSANGLEDYIVGE
ncbi:putative protein CXorf58 [Thoreauomyces humboldtii]|nr:putative protein CXorf58 [Thoreauomyces humboldtii]